MNKLFYRIHSFYVTHFTSLGLEQEILLLQQKTYQQDMQLQTLSIALARLTFIKPENLVRESQNNQANAEYFLRMTKIVEKLIDEQSTTQKQIAKN